MRKSTRKQFEAVLNALKPYTGNACYDVVEKPLWSKSGRLIPRRFKIRNVYYDDAFPKSKYLTKKEVLFFLSEVKYFMLPFIQEANRQKPRRLENLSPLEMLQHLEELA